MEADIAFSVADKFLKSYFFKVSLELVIFCHLFFSHLQAEDFLGVCSFKCCGSHSISLILHRIILVFIELSLSKCTSLRKLCINAPDCALKMSSYIFNGLEMQ